MFIDKLVELNKVHKFSSLADFRIVGPNRAMILGDISVTFYDEEEVVDTFDGNPETRPMHVEIKEPSDDSVGLYGYKLFTITPYSIIDHHEFWYFSKDCVDNEDVDFRSCLCELAVVTLYILRDMNFPK
jgi:hypothetical protein